MSGKQHLDDFLREKLNELPKGSTDGFARVQQKMAVKRRRKMAVFFLAPLVILGVVWLFNFTEEDLSIPANKEMAPSLPVQIAPERKQKIEGENADVAFEMNESNSNVLNDVAAEEVPVAMRAKQELVPESVSSSPNKKQFTTEVSTNKSDSPSTFAAPENGEERTTETKSDPVKATVETKEINSNSDVAVAEVGLRNKGANTKEIATVEPENVAGNNGSETAVSTQDYEVDGLIEKAENNLPREGLNKGLPKETDRWSLTLNIYPNYTFREFKVNSNYINQVNNRYEDIIESSEKGGYAFNLGADLRYHLGNNVFIGTGLGFIQTKINGTYEFEITNKPVVDSKGNILSYEPFQDPVAINQGIIQAYRYLQVPLHVSYQPWATKKLRLVIEGGFSYIRFLNADGKTIDHQSLQLKELKHMHYNKNMISFDAKIGVIYYPTPKVGFGVEPTMSYFNSSLYQEGPVYVVPWSVGVNLNIRLKLF